MPEVADQAERLEALDPARSFIVQAPAGSGKTELLVQRFLTLLSLVEAPEEIRAITFTRKAVGEMRERIIAALERADNDTPPQEAHARQTWEIARAVRALDKERNWNLRQHPARLRIHTIDAFNASFTRQLPLLSGYGANPTISDNTNALYSEAARRVIARLDENSPQSTAVADFLLHHDNRVDLAEQRLVAMLACRDQWLPMIMSSSHVPLDALTETFAREQSLYLERVSALFPQISLQELVELEVIAAVPGTQPEDLDIWLRIANACLTDEGGWRKKCTRGVKQLLGELQTIDTLASALHRLRELPEQAQLAPQQADMIEALFSVLIHAAAELKIVFAEHGEVDHIETALRALRALGDEEQPTNLALSLDYRIQHILVDEFQDTSVTQFRLLEALTRGWEPRDGHSLFLVGDPMQSIYRFREAKVGLFLRACRHGINDVPLEFLQLTVNFRAHAPLVDWVNQCFPQLLPETGDIAAGAIPFAPSSAFKKDVNAGFALHPVFGANTSACTSKETATVIELVKKRLEETTDGQIAILVRGRTHAAELLPELRRAGLSFQCREMECLGEQPVVEDLIALTRALLHDADRTAWFSVLHAPFCGLSLGDLRVLAQASDESTLPDVLASAPVMQSLSADGRARIERIGTILQAACEHRGRDTLRKRVESAWHAMGGPAVSDGAGIEDAEAFLALLEELDEAGEIDTQTLEQKLDKLYARPDPQASVRVQVMTMHGAKGLEFDTVIVAGLHRKSQANQSELLLWDERPRAKAPSDFLLAAPGPAGDKDKDPHYNFANILNKEKDDFETCRLLYVVATRAIRRLDLIAPIKVGTKKDPAKLNRPASNTLLHRFWPMIETECESAFAGFAPESAHATLEGTPESGIYRFPADWRLPEPAAPIAWDGGVVSASPNEPVIEYDWATQSIRHTGTVVHRYLQQIGEEGLQHWNSKRIESAAPSIQAMLAGLGVDPGQLDEAQQRTIRALENTVSSIDGRWILADHEQTQNELALSTWGREGPETYIIDRCFVADGTRWIVDYKTGYREGADRAGFLRQEADRHAVQMRRYGELMSQLHPEPVRAALYFPLLDAFVAL